MNPETMHFNICLLNCLEKSLCESDFFHVQGSRKTLQTGTSILANEGTSIIGPLLTDQAVKTFACLDFVLLREEGACEMFFFPHSRNVQVAMNHETMRFNICLLNCPESRGDPLCQCFFSRSRTPYNIRKRHS